MDHIMNQIIKSLFLLFSFLWFVSQVATAQELEFTLERAIERALSQQVELQSERARLTGLEKGKGQAGALPPLAINSQWGQNNSFEFDQAFEVTQRFPFPSVFKAKKAVWQAQIDQQEANIANKELMIKTKVQQLYYQLAYLKAYQEELEQIDHLYSDFVRIAELRYQVGDIKEVDIGSAKIQKGELALRLAQSKVLTQNTQEELGLLLAIKEKFKLVFDDSLRVIPFSGKVKLPNHFIPISVLIAQREAALHARRLTWQKTSQNPEFSLGYGNQSLVGFYERNGIEQFFGANKRFHYTQIGLEIPLSFGANKAALKQLKWELQAAELHSEQKQMEWKAALQNALRHWQQYQNEYVYYIEQALPYAQELVTAAQVGYRAGDISYLEYLYALQTTGTTRLNYLNSINQLNQIILEIHQLTNQ